VAATRAKKHLYLTYPTIAKNWDGWVVCRPSKFIKELPGGTYEKWVVEEDNSHSEWYM
jgi:superfamily I DNA/RNA helicase